VSEETVKRSRLFFVDNLRVFLTVLVILHHLAIVYGASGGFAYVEPGADELTTILLTLFAAINAPYFMGFFFLIAGYFSPGSYDRKGFGQFLRDRLVRLGIPIVVYMFTLNPLINYLVGKHVYGSTLSPGRAYVESIRNHFRYGLGVDQLWFVLVLLVFGVVYAILRRLADVRASSGAPSQARVVEARPPSNLEIAGFALVLGFVTFLVRIWFPMDDWRKILVVYLEFGHMPQYILLFAAGIVAYRRDWFRTIPDKTGKLWLWIAVGFIVLLPIIFIAGGVMEGKQDLFTGGSTWQALVTAIWEGFLCVSMIVGLLILFLRRLSSQGPLLGAMATSAYATYVVHGTVLVSLGLVLSGVQLHHLPKYILVAPVAVAASFLIGYGLKKLPGARKVL
jgi:hypothetical protein